MSDDRYIVRIGDDGKAKSRHASLGEAREAAKKLAANNWSGKAQIIDTADGWKETVRAPHRERVM